MSTEFLADFDEFKKQVYPKLKIQSLSFPSLADGNTGGKTVLRHSPKQLK